MNYIANTRSAVLWMSVFTAGLTLAHASIIQPTATLPPPSGVYPMPLVCLPVACLQNALVSGFINTTDIVSGGNELVTTQATLTADVFQNNSGSPGAALGSLSTVGTMNITYFGRTLSVPLGTFNAQITAFDFTGTFNGHPFEVKQNPSPGDYGSDDDHRAGLHRIISGR